MVLCEDGNKAFQVEETARRKKGRMPGPVLGKESHWLGGLRKGKSYAWQVTLKPTTMQRGSLSR